MGKKVAVLKYNPEESAPKMVAKGEGYVAEKILEQGELYDIPVYEDKKLIEDLFKMDIGDAIPPDLYSVVAEILVFVNDMDQLKGKLNGKKDRE